MKKKIMRLTLCAILFALCSFAEAQQPKTIYRMGYLSSLSSSSESTRAEAIRLALRELGYIEGQNIAIESRYGEGKLNRAPELAVELVRLKVDIILITGGTNWIRAARDARRGRWG
jgi:putative ABC transport system substrate-binding protein